MPVKIRLTRMGKKKQPSYRVVVVDSRRPRDGAFIEQIGRYDARHDPSIVEIDNDRALDWLHKGAQPTERARKLLEISGAWTRFRVARGDIHTIEPTAHPPETETAPSETPQGSEPGHTPEVHVVGDAEESPSPAPATAAPETGTADEPAPEPSPVPVTDDAAEDEGTTGDVVAGDEGPAGDGDEGDEAPERATAQSGTGESGSDESGSDESGSDESGSDESGSDEPATEEERS